MDILFSPYGVGGLPKSTLAEIERRTEDLLKSSSFQRMIELDKKYKVCVPSLRPHSSPAGWLGPCRCPSHPYLTSRHVSNVVCWHPNRWTAQEALSNFSPRLGSRLCSKTALPQDQSGPTLCSRRSNSSW